MKALFVCGTDTGVGKTLVTGLLAHFFSQQNIRVITQKWIQTGAKGFSQDITMHLELMGKTLEEIKPYLNFVSPYIFKLAASPHLAAKQARKPIRIDVIKNSFKRLKSNFDAVIVEGIGGALVPINEKELMIDIVRELDLGVIVVAANRLGTINHTLLTLEALKARRIKIIGVIFNGQPGKINRIITEDNPRIIGNLAKERILGSLPFSPDLKIIYRKFEPIGKNILSILQQT